jgi:hypothetical protein
VAGFVWAIAPAVAQQKASPPDFSSNHTVGWVGLNGNGPFFSPVASRVPKEHMRKDIAEVLAGKIAFTARSSCMMAGVPGFMAFGGASPYYFIQTPKQVWIVYAGDQQVRRVVPHSAHPKPSWYGESVGHYDGDTLVVDTIGMNSKTVVDPYRTPHSDKLHVVERWRMVDNGQAMEVSFTAEDPDAFNEPWSGTRRFRRVQQEYTEEVCAENNQHLFDYHIPTAHRPDF